MRTHTGEKPYICKHPGCTKKYAQQSNLTAHKRHHTGVGLHKCMHAGCKSRCACTRALFLRPSLDIFTGWAHGCTIVSHMYSHSQTLVVRTCILILICELAAQFFSHMHFHSQTCCIMVSHMHSHLRTCCAILFTHAFSFVNRVVCIGLYHVQAANSLCKQATSSLTCWSTRVRSRTCARGLAASKDSPNRQIWWCTCAPTRATPRRTYQIMFGQALEDFILCLAAFNPRKRG
jgi:hypothetical protein